MGIAYHETSGSSLAATVLSNYINLFICHIHVLNYISYFHTIIGIFENVAVFNSVFIIKIDRSIGTTHIAFTDYESTFCISKVNRSTYFDGSKHRIPILVDTYQSYNTSIVGLVGISRSFYC